MAVVTLGVRLVPLIDVVRVCACGLCAPCCVVLLGSWNGTIAPFQHVQRVRDKSTARKFYNFRRTVTHTTTAAPRARAPIAHENRNQHLLDHHDRGRSPWSDFAV